MVSPTPTDDFDSISDFVLKMNYTTREGGASTVGRKRRRRVKAARRRGALRRRAT